MDECRAEIVAMMRTSAVPGLSIAVTRPDRVVYASNESGVWQVHAWDVATGARRQVTDHPVGLVDGTQTLDGEGVLWFQDETGDESGQWYVQPFAGGESRPFLEGVPHGWNEASRSSPTSSSKIDTNSFFSPVSSSLRERSRPACWSRNEYPIACANSPPSGYWRE